MPISELYISLEILGYGFIGCCFIGIVTCISRLLNNCYNKYILRLPAPEEPVNTNSPFYNLTGRYAKATAIITPTAAPVNSIDDGENVIVVQVV